MSNPQTSATAVAQEGQTDLPISNKSGLSDVDVHRIAAAVCERLSKVQPPTSSETRYWSVELAAHECGQVSKRTFAEWMADGSITYYKKKGRVLIDPKLLDEELSKFRRRRSPKRRKRQPQQQTPALAQAPISGQLG